MKNSFLTILLLIPVHFVIAQNVKIIHASERATENRAVINPTPSDVVPVPASSVNATKTNPSTSSKSSVNKKDGVKEVKECSEKKQCVKKVNSQKKNSTLPLRGKSSDSDKQ
ncbi:MAG: hypothetical protein JJE25_02185 [Bacteroidia bacterium]|nr:hypothetical protein [Bacteroidia bacterium]